MAGGQQQEQDRTEPATPFRLREARQRGQVAKSLEVNSLLLLGTALALSYLVGERVIGGLLDLCRRWFANAHRTDLDGPMMVAAFESTFGALLQVLWPVVGAIVLVSILANLLQTGPVFSFTPLKPDINRINPVAGFKRIFSKRLLYESVKTVIKMGVLGGVIWLTLKGLMPELLASANTDPQAYPRALLEGAQRLVYPLVLVLVLIALLDVAFTRWEYSDRMRMSRRELKDEVKRREGDPQVRARRRALQREAVQRAGSIRRVPDADVLITNPTRLAVALKYTRDTMAAPQVTAKGAGSLASSMREMARRHGVPIVENRRLARDLFRDVAIDEAVPPALFPTVARILAWVFLQRQRQTAVLEA